MIPILFEHEEASFTSNGICRLPDCVSCLVTEVVNGQYECVFEYPITGKHYEEIIEDRIIYTTHDDSKTPQPFDIYKRSAPMEGIVTFYARHISYRLNNVICQPFSANSIQNAIAGVKSNSINYNPFTFTTTQVGGGSLEIATPVSVRSVLGDEDNSILKSYGGEFSWDKFAVSHVSRRGTDRDVQLRYGKNLEDIRYDKDITPTYQAVVPFWKSSDGKLLKMHTNKIIYTVENPTVIDDHVKLKTAILDLSSEFDDVPYDTSLATKSVQALADSMVPESTIEVRFFELWNTTEYQKYAALQRVYLGDSVTVVYTELGLNVSMRVVKAVYDSLLERYDSMELGDVQDSFGTSVANSIKNEILKIAPTIDVMAAAIDHGTELITGGLGGYVVIGTNADGQPEEILIMDTDNKATAVNVIRINKNGIGFSHTGYQGPFVSAWTIDSEFYADFITAGTLNANLIKAGILQAVAGLSNIDMTTGEFYFGSATDYLHFYKNANDQYVFDARLTNLSLTANGDMAVSEADLDFAFSTYDPADALDQQAVFNLLSNNGAVQGMWLANGQLYFNFTYAQGGTLKLGGQNNGNGLLEIYNSTGNKIATIDNSGIELYESYYDIYHTWHSKLNGGKLTFWMKGSGQGGMDSNTHSCGEISTYSIGTPGSFEYYLNIIGNGTGILFNILSGATQIEIVKMLSDGVYFSKPIKNGLTINGGATVNGGITLPNGGTISGGYLYIPSGESIGGRATSIFTNYDIYSLEQVWGTSFQQHSDRRLKENIEEVENDIIDDLHVVSFDWKKDKTHVSAGFIAQEVQKICPELVQEDPEGMLSLNYIGIVPHLVHKVQQQQMEIDILKAEIAEIKALLRGGSIK